ncbi:MAG: sulfate permease-like transporter, superfamily [Bacteroidetes bacterium]|nr:sulfate permease-like transporter, superfamily [Bacteroidota bacterium]
MKSTNILADLKSGLVVFLVALPLCLGIALACNVPLFSGILAGVIGGIIVTTFSGSVLSVSGPAAGLTAIVLSAIASLGSFDIFLAAVLFAGVFQIILGFLKAGRVGNYIPVAVIKGMLAGIGIILIIKQLPHLVGYDKDPEGDFEFVQPDGHNTISELFYMVNNMTPGSVIIGLVSVVILLVTTLKFYKNNKFFSQVPGPLIVVVVGVILNVIFSGAENLKIEKEHLVNLPVINSWDDFRSNLVFPNFSHIGTSKFWVIVFTIGIVASLESLLSIEATDKLDPLKRESNSNKELVAQGIGNSVAGLLGALPVTAVIVRSSANIHAGATSKLSAIFHATLLFLCVLLIPGVLMLIPNSALAAILIITGYKLANVGLFKEHLKNGADQFLPFVITIFVMLLTDLLKGVGAGLVTALAFMIVANVRSKMVTVHEKEGGKSKHIIKLPEQFTFINKSSLVRYFETIEKDSTVVIDATENKNTDKIADEAVQKLIEESKQKNIQVELIDYTPNK